MVIAIRLTPNARADRVEGILVQPDIEPLLRVRVRAVPEKGRANKALMKLMADWLGVPKSTISLQGGSRSRIKRIHITGETEQLAGRFLDALRALPE